MLQPVGRKRAHSSSDDLSNEGEMKKREDEPNVSQQANDKI